LPPNSIFSACLPSKSGKEKPVGSAAGVVDLVSLVEIEAAAVAVLVAAAPAFVRAFTMSLIALIRGSLEASSESTIVDVSRLSNSCVNDMSRGSPVPPANVRRWPLLSRSTLIDEVIPLPAATASVIVSIRVMASAISERPSFLASVASDTGLPDRSLISGSLAVRTSRISLSGMTASAASENTGVRIWLTAAPTSSLTFSK